MYSGQRDREGHGEDVEPFNARLEGDHFLAQIFLGLLQFAAHFALFLAK